MHLTQLTKIFLLFITSFYMISFVFAEEWYGPTLGPLAQKSKFIIYIASDYQNGGVTAVYRGLEDASKKLGWKLGIMNGNGSKEQIQKDLQDAVKQQPDAIVLGGFQPTDFSENIKQAKAAHITLVGWHAAERPGTHPDLFVNVATDSNEVATVAARYVINESKGKVGVVIFNDNRFDVANAKTKAMKEEIQKCKRCSVLSIENIPIANAAFEVSLVVPKLIKKFGKQWTHTLAINDIYFDNMNTPLNEAKRKDIKNISAGDGSNSAISRIKSGLSQQVATVAEPLRTQGWQIADELNRAFAREKPSGFVTKPILVTTSFLKNLNNKSIESNIGYEKAYLKIWKINEK
ncbi:substrate-binding domain-containing protein [Silvanigrella aquatica]|uniref:Periplasmic binding protein domain-containing protein n=1 Tax=Silvanigrella aquatica TaxID=1915309 RepID=A0A1L4CXD9_9BACT|nr:substrate-binding domain-containing protein [Silvanigrella aquatica]APJ02609.1 hypothetical protein AXG55_01130 [Silvanigrella aquatica]